MISIVIADPPVSLLSELAPHGTLAIFRSSSSVLATQTSKPVPDLSTIAS